MKDFLKRYEGTLTVKGPVFVGSGKKIEKNEYLFLENKIGVMDIASFYGFMCKKGKREEFEKYLMNNKGPNLSAWLENNKINKQDIFPYLKYTVDRGEFEVQNSQRRGLEVLEFTRDSYGKPFVPGSSIKGMLRTILLSEDIMLDPQKHRKEKEAINAELFSKKNKVQLQKEISQIECNTFRTLECDADKQGNATNDIMKGIIISDSSPLENEDLVLCQKVEVLPDGKIKKLNILRECLKPGTKIHFSVTIDTNIFQYDDCDIKNAVEIFINSYYEHFVKFFNFDRPGKNAVYLGGGCGFVSKTIIYPMFDDDGVKITQKIFQKTNVPKEHGHQKDSLYGVSPHVLKCTSYEGKLMQMGLCELELSAV